MLYNSVKQGWVKYGTDHNNSLRIVYTLQAGKCIELKTL